MRYLAVTETCDLASLYVRLVGEGHQVKVHISEPEARGTGLGLFTQIESWRDELGWIQAAGDDGIIIFESVSEGFGALQDTLRRDGYKVVGGSAFGDRLENDRAFAQTQLGQHGLQIAPVYAFDSIAAANAFIVAQPARYVLKFSGPNFASSDNYLGQRDDGSDVLAILAAHTLRGTTGQFILMPFLRGVEVGVGAYFNGTRFILPACLDWEHKRFFAGDLGELTGEMGTVATFDDTQDVFMRTLFKLEPLLRGRGHVGWINLNTIVNADGIWPLELTCRFGYPGFAVLEPLQAIGWGELLKTIAGGFDTLLATHPGFSVGVVVTTPPFPYTRKQVAEPIGLPVWIDETLDDVAKANLHFGEIGLVDGRLVTSGLYGWTMVVTGTGATVAAAQLAAYSHLQGIAIPNMRYRLDIGDKLRDGEFERLQRYLGKG
ncbi:MAG: hypothetical protein ABI196_22115 [Bradyrhizobium sp.]